MAGDRAFSMVNTLAGSLVSLTQPPHGAIGILRGVLKGSRSSGSGYSLCLMMALVLFTGLLYQIGLRQVGQVPIVATSPRMGSRRARLGW
ncbi:MAG: hypothetical protein U0841_18915 [Chloroflexia bacterium]